MFVSLPRLLSSGGGPRASRPGGGRRGAGARAGRVHRHAGGAGGLAAGAVVLCFGGAAYVCVCGGAGEGSRVWPPTCGSNLTVLGWWWKADHPLPPLPWPPESCSSQTMVKPRPPLIRFTSSHPSRPPPPLRAGWLRARATSWRTCPSSRTWRRRSAPRWRSQPRSLRQRCAHRGSTTSLHCQPL